MKGEGPGATPPFFSDPAGGAPPHTHPPAMFTPASKPLLAAAGVTAAAVAAAAAPHLVSNPPAGGRDLCPFADPPASVREPPRGHPTRVVPVAPPGWPEVPYSPACSTAAVFDLSPAAPAWRPHPFGDKIKRLLF